MDERPPLLPLLLPWLSVPLTWLQFHRHWDQLPVQMAVHFDAAWHPNGWTSRDGALEFGLGITAFIAGVFTVVGLLIRMQKPRSYWPVVLISYPAAALMMFANYWIIAFNLR